MTNSWYISTVNWCKLNKQVWISNTVFMIIILIQYYTFSSTTQSLKRSAHKRTDKSCLFTLTMRSKKLVNGPSPAQIHFTKNRWMLKWTDPSIWRHSSMLKDHKPLRKMFSKNNSKTMDKAHSGLIVLQTSLVIICTIFVKFDGTYNKFNKIIINCCTNMGFSHIYLLYLERMNIEV